MRLHLFVLALLFSAFVFAGCDFPLPASAACDTTDQCAEGLSCLDFSVHPAADKCEVVGKVCSTACETDKDCEGLGNEGETFKCFRNCDESSTCGRADVK